MYCKVPHSKTSDVSPDFSSFSLKEIICRGSAPFPFPRHSTYKRIQPKTNGTTSGVVLFPGNMHLQEFSPTEGKHGVTEHLPLSDMDSLPQKQDALSACLDKYCTTFIVANCLMSDRSKSHSRCAHKRHSGNGETDGRGKNASLRSVDGARN